MVKRVSKKMSPLYIMSDSRLLCYKNGSLFILVNGEVIRKIPIFGNIKERILSKVGLAYRFLRLGIRAVAAIDANHIVISKGNLLYEVDLESGEMSPGFFCGKGRRPLIFTSIRNINGFENGIYYGDYLGVFDKSTINIKQRVGIDRWNIVYSFPPGTIDHIHNIVPDPFRQCVWIFTGDMGEAAAIWKATDNFKKVECVACNNQKYRGCVAFADKEGLVYATDAPFADNYIYLFNTQTFQTSPLRPIHGSCIYGCQWNEKQVFSSTVEGDMFKTKKEFLFSKKRGVGIKDDYVHMYIGTSAGGYEEVYKEKKDSYPLYAFQFGVFKFPYGVNKTDTLYFQPIATKKNDLSLMELK